MYLLGTRIPKFGALRWHIREIYNVPSIGQPLYYERTRIGGLEEKQGSNNPFQSIGGIHYCGHFSIADWDGDGDMDIFMTDLADSLLYFQQSNGRFEFVEANPFLKIQDRIKFRKPLMVDWNNDGLMDLVLVQQPLRPA